MQPTTQKIPVLTVSELTRSIKRQLEEQYKVVWLQGEVSNSKLHSSGHFYFSLKDAEAQISAVMFRGAVSRLKNVPRDGDRVIVRGEISVYPPQGRYQIIVQEMKPQGLGELLQKLEELKKTLKARGWFEDKKPIPQMPKRIGIVTSPTGAAIQDMINVINRRFAGVHVILNPVRVQGEGASKEIAQAIVEFNQYDLVDVIIVGRGGGSIEDLWAFNELPVAEAIHNSRIPVISAVGHETDTTLADYVADLRAPTPSAAAELVIGEKEGQLKTLAQVVARLNQLITHTVAVRREKLSSLARQPIFTSPYGLLGPLMQRIDHLQKRLQTLKPTVQIAHLRSKLTQLYQQLVLSWQMRQQQKRQHFQKLTTALSALDPKNVLKKGYAIPFKGRSVIGSVTNVQPDDSIRMVLSDGEIIATVKETHERKKRTFL